MSFITIQFIACACVPIYTKSICLPGDRCSSTGGSHDEQIACRVIIKLTIKTKKNSLTTWESVFAFFFYTASNDNYDNYYNRAANNDDANNK